ncbi:unnamed protein product [Polarella glacialis]|uniref:Uncharacterized protein n=1 Tax=Polarella glacialis TaxID=89957 RepID=A0A813K555_POLGL|nr:unnamed protein product [Polarella glacialis]
MVPGQSRHSLTSGIARQLGLLAVICLCGLPASAQDDDFEFFRCDACSASFFKINRTLVERFGQRKSSIPEFEFIEILEDVCATMFTKHEYGVKQHEGKKYLFGPGVTDHIPDKGFGQMGMGDYDKRLAAYCRMFTEDVGEEKLRELFTGNQIDHVGLCRTECKSSASGTGAQTSRPKKPKAPKPPPPPAPKAKNKPKESKAQPQVQQPPLRAPATPPVAEAAAATPPVAEAAADMLEKTISYLPKLTSRQLQWLGEAVMAELASKAMDAEGRGARTEL